MYLNTMSLSEKYRKDLEEAKIIRTGVLAEQAARDKILLDEAITKYVNATVVLLEKYANEKLEKIKNGDPGYTGDSKICFNYTFEGYYLNDKYRRAYIDKLMEHVKQPHI